MCTYNQIIHGSPGEKFPTSLYFLVFASASLSSANRCLVSSRFFVCVFLLQTSFHLTDKVLPEVSGRTLSAFGEGKLWANSVLGTHVTASFLCQGGRGAYEVWAEDCWGRAWEAERGGRASTGEAEYSNSLSFEAVLSNRSLSVRAHMNDDKRHPKEVGHGQTLTSSQTTWTQARGGRS